jgi:hypothetical protein
MIATATSTRPMAFCLSVVRVVVRAEAVWLMPRVNAAPRYERVCGFQYPDDMCRPRGLSQCVC